MNDDIKEILKCMKNYGSTTELALLDYISNLQHTEDLYNQLLKDYDELQQELQRKDNNWNELKEFIQNELNNNVDKEKSFSGYQCKIILDKIKELENGNK